MSDTKEIMKCIGWKTILVDDKPVKVKCESENTIIVESVETWEYHLNYRECLDCHTKWTTGYKKHPESEPPREKTYICPL